METTIKNRIAKCPHCSHPHSYIEVFFQACNDTGSWDVTCESCSQHFGVEINNPVESSMKLNYLINKRILNDTDVKELTYAYQIVEYDSEFNKLHFKFNYNGAVLYKCNGCGSGIELNAKQALSEHFDNIKDLYTTAINYTLSTRTPDYKFLIINVAFNCNCGCEHIAKFYCDFLTNGRRQNEIDDYLLADVTGTDLINTIDGLYSKTDIMSFLGKLLIRWNLLAINVIIAVPFVGHQYLTKESKMAVWTWLLNMLDPNKVIFITRAKSFNNYKSVLNDVEGLNYALLSDYGIDNKIIHSNNKKNDFHAKFYSAVFSDRVEVMSGSANLVSGPSIENVTFKEMSNARYIERFIKPLDLEIDLSVNKNEHWVEINIGKNGISGPIPKHGDLSCL